jgi:hypothetical protein
MIVSHKRYQALMAGVAAGDVEITSHRAAVTSTTADRAAELLHI